MNLSFKKEDLIFQKEVRKFINDNLSHITKKKTEEGYHLNKEDMVNSYNKLSQTGWMAPNWPKKYGGTDWTGTQRFIFNNECAEAYAPDGEYTFGVTMVGPVLIKYGTLEQKKYYLPKATAFFQNYFVEDLTKKTEYPYYPSYLWAFFWKNSFLSYEYFGRMV